jgi:phosphate-selective porin
MSGTRARVLLALAVAPLLVSSSAAAQTSADSAPPLVGHGDKGFELRTRDGNYLLQIQARVQIRYAYPWDADPVTFDITDVDQHIFKVNRARLKVGGHGFRPWLRYYFEYELAAGNLLDFRVALERWAGLRLKAGQWKVHYNRERVISSGQQQLADRSLINRPFTVDRQQGLSLYGRLSGGGAADLSYWASVFTGTGRGSRQNDDEHLMWMGRLQWNPFGRVVSFSGSDLERRPEPAASVALAAVTNRSPYTRFSQDGGGQLEGFADGAPGQYRVNQWMAETAFMLRGFSWQQEFHWKRIIDNVNATETTLLGNYAQLGYFLHEAIGAIPPPLELALRYDIYDPNSGQPDDLQREISLAANWFFHGHLNKLTAEVSHFRFDENATVEHEGWRVRLQWDVSF